MRAATNAEELARHIFDQAVNRGMLGVIEQVYAPHFVDHAPGPDQAPGPAGIVEVVRQYREAIPDLHVTVEEVISAGDRIITRETWRGTHQQELAGISPSNKAFVATRIHIFRVENGQVVEEWTAGSILDRLRALASEP